MHDDQASGDGISATPHGRCPICRRPGEAKYRPFCSKRYSDVDLARWLGGGYVVAGGGADSDEDGEKAAHQPAEEPDDTRH